jgi:GT2 family glycosyltransferase
MTKVAVVILNWNGNKYLKQFLPSVVEYSAIDGVEIWVADNGSTDASISLLSSEFPTVKILQLDKNYGFTGGYNRALAKIEAEYFVLLNSDIEVTPNWIEPVIKYMDTYPEVGAAMPKLLAFNNKVQFEYAGAAGGFIDLLGFPFCRGRLLSETESDSGQYDDIIDIFWATGACMFVRAKLFHEMGGLDEDFFAHMEEIDFCWRIKNRGHKVVYIPDSKVYHVGGGTLPNNNPRKLFLNYRNNLYLLYKNLPKGRVVRVLFLRMILDGASALMYLLQGNFSFFMAVPKAHFSFYSTIGKFAKKRKENLKLRTVHKHPEMFRRSIVYSFFVRKVRKFSDLSLKGWRK